MKSKMLGRKCASLLAAGGLLLGTSCTPDNFWMNMWGTSLNSVVGSTAGAVVDVYVTSQLIDFLGVDEDNNE